MAKLPKNRMSARQKCDAEKRDATRAGQEAIANLHWPARSVHKNLRRYRLAEGLKKSDMARLMEVTARTYYGYEQGARPIPSDALVQLGIFRGADLNEVLLGQSRETDSEAADRILNEVFKIMDYLANEYREMDGETARAAADIVIKLRRDGLPRLHPEVIKDAILIVTGYWFHPEDIPALPDEEQYDGDYRAFEAAFAEWQRAVKW